MQGLRTFPRASAFDAVPPPTAPSPPLGRPPLVISALPPPPHAGGPSPTTSCRLQPAPWLPHDVSTMDDDVSSMALGGLDAAGALTALLEWLDDETRAVLRGADVPRPIDLFIAWAAHANRSSLETVCVRLYRVVHRTMETVQELAVANGATAAPRSGEWDVSGAWSVATPPTAAIEPHEAVGSLRRTSTAVPQPASPMNVAGGTAEGVGTGLSAPSAAVHLPTVPGSLPDPMMLSESAIPPDGKLMSLTPPSGRSPVHTAAALPKYLPILMQSTTSATSPTKNRIATVAETETTTHTDATSQGPLAQPALRSRHGVPPPQAESRHDAAGRGLPQANQSRPTVPVGAAASPPGTEDATAKESTTIPPSTTMPPEPVLAQFAPVGLVPFPHTGAASSAVVVAPPPSAGPAAAEEHHHRHRAPPASATTTSTIKTDSTGSKPDGAVGSSSDVHLLPIERDSLSATSPPVGGTAATVAVAQRGAACVEHDTMGSTPSVGGGGSSSDNAAGDVASGDVRAALRGSLLYHALQGTKSNYALYLSRRPSLPTSVAPMGSTATADSHTAAAAAETRVNEESAQNDSAPGVEPPRRTASAEQPVAARQPISRGADGDASPPGPYSGHASTPPTAAPPHSKPADATAAAAALPTRPDWSNNEALSRFFAGNATISQRGSIHVVNNAARRRSVAFNDADAASGGGELSTSGRSASPSHSPNGAAVSPRRTSTSVPLADMPRVLVYNTSTTSLLPPADMMSSAPVNVQNTASHVNQATQGGALPPTAEHVPESNAEFERIGPWMMVDRLGAGKQGEVHLAVHETTGQCCAIKKMRKTKPKSLHAQVQREQLNRELSLSLSFTHPNIVKALELIKPKRSEYVFLVMELMPGGALAHVQDDGTCNTLSLPALHKVARQAASALRYLHGMKVVHRDIKPDNFLLDAAGNVQLSDFGVCVFNDPADRHGGAAQQVEGFAGQGALSYRAPEEFIEAARAPGPHVDMWSLGVSLYAMTFGALPFRAETYDALRSAICNRDPDYAFTTAALADREARDEGPAKDGYAAALEGWIEGVLKPLLVKSRQARLRARGLEAVLENLESALQ